MFWLIPALIAIAIAGTLAFSVIKNWFQSKKTQTTKYGVMIKERLKNGKYSIIGGVFDTKDKVTEAQKWETDSIDQELQREFGRENEVIVTL